MEFNDGKGLFLAFQSMNASAAFIQRSALRRAWGPGAAECSLDPRMGTGLAKDWGVESESAKVARDSAIRAMAR